MAASSTNQVGWHTFHCGKQQFKVPIRYQEPVDIGHGAFGAVM